ncbi:hypothetical protein FDECE_16442 [Fusarium decemcellulare]|nr:hypothetical protein FDECE_16442 [Fusarium decemcellulare]
MKITKCIIFGLSASGAAAASLDLRLISYNIRLDEDNLEDGERPWPERLPLMASQLNRQIDESDNLLMCLQEGLRPQLQDLQQWFSGPWWDFLGWGRNGGRSGEYSSIIYQKSKWEVTNENTYWFTPGLWQGENEPGAKGWDATHPRIMNVARLKHKQTGASVVYICTHLEYAGKVAARESAKLVAEYANKWSEGGKYPVFVGGDLNHQPGSEPYNNIAARLSDAREVIPPEHHSGFSKTYTGFTSDGADDELIDYIFVRDKDSVELVDYDVLNNKPGRTWISDHRPVVVNVKVPY